MIASKAFYQVTTDIKEHLLANDVTNTVTYGALSDVDLEKQTIFPLCHLMTENVTVNPNTLVFSFTLLAMDIVHDRIEAPEVSNDDNRFNGTDNEMDVLNTQLWVCNNLLAHLRRGDLSNGYEVTASACEPFSDRFTNRLSGWSLPFEITLHNDITAC